MRFTGTNESGNDEFECNDGCGRKVELQYGTADKPTGKLVEKEPGDRTVQHTGGVGGVSMGESGAVGNFGNSFEADESRDDAPLPGAFGKWTPSR